MIRNSAKITDQILTDLKKGPKSSKNLNFQYFNPLTVGIFFSANLIDKAYHTICAFGLYKF